MRGHWFWIISNAFNFKILFYSTKNNFQNSSSCSFRDNTILVREWQMLNVFYRYIFMHEHENSTFTLIFKHWFLQAHNKFSFIYFLKYQVVWIFNKHVLVLKTFLSLMRVFGLRQLAHQFDFLTVHMLKAEADTERQQSKIIQQPQKKYTVHQQDTNKLMVWNYHHSHTKLFSFLQFILYASTCFILQNFGT